MMEKPHPLQRLTALLLRSSHWGWIDVRLALDAVPSLSIIEDTPDPRQAIMSAGSTKPDLIISADRLDKERPHAHLEEFRARSPDSKLIVIAAQLEPAHLPGLAEFDAAAFILWQDLSTDAMHHLVAAVLPPHELVVTSQQVAHLFVATQCGLRPPHETPANLVNERERTVLMRLAKGQTHEAIAHMEGMSRHTVERIIGGLKAKLDAPSLFVLGAKARALGLIE